MHVTLTTLLSGCGGHSSGLTSARDRLDEAMTTRDPAQVSRAAREAGAYEGQDPTLDRLLGDALANVLMRPHEGLKILESIPARGNHDEAWATAVGSAAMRTGEQAVLSTLLARTEAPAIETSPELLSWTATRALQDPQLSIHSLRELTADCQLYDSHPSRGRRTVDQPAPHDLPQTLTKMGGDRVVLGRAETPTDPAPESGRGLQPCTTGRLFAEIEWPRPLPRHLTVSTAIAEYTLHMSVRPESGLPWVFGSTRDDIAGEVVAEARRVSEGGDPDPTFLRSRFAGGKRPAEASRAN